MWTNLALSAAACSLGYIGQMVDGGETVLTVDNISFELKGRLGDLDLGKQHLSVRYESGPKIVRVGACIERYDWDHRSAVIDALLAYEADDYDDLRSSSTCFYSRRYRTTHTPRSSVGARNWHAARANYHTEVAEHLHTRTEYADWRLSRCSTHPCIGLTGYRGDELKLPKDERHPKKHSFEPGSRGRNQVVRGLMPLKISRAYRDLRSSRGEPATTSRSSKTPWRARHRVRPLLDDVSKYARMMHGTREQIPMTLRDRLRDLGSIARTGIRCGTSRASVVGCSVTGATSCDLELWRGDSVCLTQVPGPVGPGAGALTARYERTERVRRSSSLWRRRGRSGQVQEPYGRLVREGRINNTQRMRS